MGEDLGNRNPYMFRGCKSHIQLVTKPPPPNICGRNIKWGRGGGRVTSENSFCQFIKNVNLNLPSDPSIAKVFCK